MMFPLLAALASSPAQAHIPVIYTATPDDDWCGIIAGALGGDYIMLTPGDYVGPCDITGLVSKPEGEVTIVQSFDADDPARMVHDGASDYILRIDGPGVLNLLQLTFGPVPAGVDAVRIGDGNDMMVRYSRFEGGEGRGVVQDGDVELLRVLDNWFEAPLGDAAVVGCAGCVLGDFGVEGNVIVGGAGALVVASDVPGDVADNTVADHEGTPLQVEAAAAEVRRNYVEGAAAIEAAIVANNIITGEATLSAEQVLHNTLTGSVDVSGSQDVSANATLGVDLGPGNVVCDEDCFVDLAGRDYFPPPGSPLRQAAAWTSAAPTDFCANARTDPTAAGAVEGEGGEGFGPVEITYRSLADCTVLPATTSTGETADSGSPTVDSGLSRDLQVVDDGGGCGCAGAPWPTGVLWWVGLLALARRRTSSPPAGATTRLG